MKFFELTFAFPDFYLLMRFCHYLVHGLEVPAYIWDEQNIFLTFDFKTKIALYRIYIGLYIFFMEEVQKRFSGFSGFPDQPVPENRMLPVWANPWTKRSPTTPQAWRLVQPIH